MLPALISRPTTTTPTASRLHSNEGGTHGVASAQLRNAVGEGVGKRSSEGAFADAHNTASRAQAAMLGRVLLVDDEALVRRTLALFLTRAGFAVVAVEGGAEALDLLRTAGEEFDLLVTDQSMPGMTGRELIGAARRFCPELSFLLVSGYDMSDVAEQLPADISLLRKPVERAAFLNRVRALLSLVEDEDGEGV